MSLKYQLQKSIYLKFNNLSQFSNLVQFVSTRLGGVSQPPYDSLNLGFGTSDTPENVSQNRKILAETLEIPLENFCVPQQTHSANSKIITSQDAGKGIFTKETALPNTDGLISNQTNICLLVQSADCVPVLMYDSKNQVIAAVHAGWRGTVQKIVANTFEQMKNTFNSTPEHIWVGVGASISPECYEIGEEVVESVEKAFKTKEKYLIWNKITQKYHLDLWFANQQTLIEMGIPSKQIEIMGICTQKNSDMFFSSRQAKGITGRFGAGIMLK
jgi:polyphenol oxidase